MFTRRTSLALVGVAIKRAALKVRFINVLVRPELLQAFMGVYALPSELALESLLFVLDVERFRHVQPSMARLLANYIYLSYIAPQAPLRVNKSSMMRDRIPCPFLPGWAHNPCVFDEVLASVGFMLKKHTPLRFECSPVSLRTLMDAPEFEPDWYVVPLCFDSDTDPMAAIAAQFEPDIDVVIWVNELQADSQQMLAGLATLTVAFHEQLLQRVAVQFVDGHYALCLCDGYFRLALHIAPLQKQRKIKKTHKLRSFFGDNLHEALLRHQLMAAVLLSLHIPAACAAAELIASKLTAEVCLRSNAAAAAANPGSGSGSATSSLIAEHQLLAMDSDSDVEDERQHGWAHEAMRRPSTSEIPHHTLPSAAAAAADAPLRVRSWSDTDTDDESDAVAPAIGAAGAAVNSNGRTTDKERPLPLLPVRRAHCVYNDQALNRALSMVGTPNNDSHDSTSSDGSNSPWQQHQGQRRRGLDDPTTRLDAADAAASTTMDAHSFSVYTTHSLASLGRAAWGSCFECKKRADKLHKFFGRMDPGAGAIDEPAPMAASAGLAAVLSIPSLRGCSMADAPLSAEQRNVLVHCRHKLKALLGEQVKEGVISLAPAAPAAASGRLLASSLQAGVPDAAFHLSNLGGSACSLLLMPKYTLQASSGGMSAGPSSADSHGGVLGLAVPVGDEQHERTLWRCNKLVGILGDVPSDIDTHYMGDSNAMTGSDVDGPADTTQQQQQDWRQWAKKLRHFFGQSLNMEAMLMQEVACSQPPTDSPALSGESFDMVPGPAPAKAASWPPLLLQEDPPVRAQFWMMGSPESQESVLSDEATSHQSSLLATLRAHKATIIGSIRRAPAGCPTASLPASARSQTSMQSSLALSSAGSQRNSAHSAAAAATVPSPGKLALLAHKIKPRSDADQSAPLPAMACLLGDARSLPQSPLVLPVHSSSIKLLSPLPAISPNNLQASIDRFIPPVQHQHQQPASALPQTMTFLPRISSAAHTDDHRHLIAAALLGTAPQGTRTHQLPPPPPPPPLTAPPARCSNSSKAGATKSIHWFDSLVDVPRDAAPTAMPAPLVPMPSDEPVAPVDNIPLPSAKSSLKSTMLIVLCSPSTKRPPARSPMVSPRVAVASVPPVHSRFPALPITSPTSSAHLLLSHKASVSAVGGWQLRGNAECPRPLLDECVLAHATSTTTVTRAPLPANM
ncbi:hypothetical protein H4R19_001932 [Coemansia spiralis]|nr:hypothetical protein H4R19_001932 [Coemansia spiralis]